MSRPVRLEVGDVLFNDETIGAELPPQQAWATDSFWKTGVLVVPGVLSADQGSLVNDYLGQSSRQKGLWNGYQSETPDDSARQISSVDVSRLQQKTRVDIYDCIKYAQ